MTSFAAPSKAKQHCRHYDYVLPITRQDSGPRCAVGVDLSAPGASNCCMPPREGQQACASREDWTEVERVAWNDWVEQRKSRLIAAIGALPRPIPLNTSASVECPNCGVGCNIRVGIAGRRLAAQPRVAAARDQPPILWRAVP